MFPVLIDGCRSGGGCKKHSMDYQMAPAKFS